MDKRKALVVRIEVAAEGFEASDIVSKRNRAIRDAAIVAAVDGGVPGAIVAQAARLTIDRVNQIVREARRAASD